MKKIVFLGLSILFFSCQKSFHPEKYQGCWAAAGDDLHFLPLPTINFKNDSIFFTDTFTHVSAGNFSIKGNKIKISTHNETFEKEFRFHEKDSSIQYGRNIYYLKPHWKPNYLGKYELLNINTSNRISFDSLSKYDTGFHLIQDYDNTVKVKLNEKLSGLEDIIPFTFRTSFKNYKGNVIYLGKGITLKDLVDCYLELTKINQLKVILVTNFDLNSNEYNILPERINIWNHQVYNHFKNEPIFNGFSGNIRSEYIRYHSPLIISINSKEDFGKINQLKSEHNYIISTNKLLSLKDYFELKDLILDIKKEKGIQIRTEIIDFPPDS